MPKNTIWWKPDEILSNKAEYCSFKLENTVYMLFFSLYAVLKALFHK
jgi:hypothetical protein